MSLGWEGVGCGELERDPSLVAGPDALQAPFLTWRCPPYSGNTELVSACQLLTSGF